MDDQMKIRRLNFQVTCLQNGLRIEKGQANVVSVENHKLKREVDRLESSGDSLQAKIDSLMLEYCPDEMTKEQLAIWESHQRVNTIAEVTQ
jgi:hypothetical protein